ncbi:MAG: replication-associated recombination protein A [Bdellovibrionales bacterium]
MDLFSSLQRLSDKPLSEILRPQNLEELLGQKSIDSQSKLGKLIRSGWVPSLILWGPPGTGKTSFAQALSQITDSHFESINAVDAGTKVLKEMGDAARSRLLQHQKKTLLFLDEIHRFNKSQQDVLLPFMERGDFTLIGATTENPSYELNKAVLSRSRVVVFERLKTEDLFAILKKIEIFYNKKVIQIADEIVIEYLYQFSDGDARRFINSWELIFKFLAVTQQECVSIEDVQEILQAPVRSYDKNSESHYDVISAFIKSVRGSDPDAAVYYLARMLDGGEDVSFIARRLMILASEDVGNADPRALSLAVSGMQAVEAVGMPEARIILSQVTVYLSCCPKSNASYVAINKALEKVEQTGSLPVPLHLRSSKTEMSKGLGYGKDYQYPHAFPKAWVQQNYLPQGIGDSQFYQPQPRGFEKNILEFMQWLKK